MLVLVEPALAYKNACLAAVREFHTVGEYDVDAEQLGAQFAELLSRLAAAKDPATAPAGELAYEDFWLMDGDPWIGKLTLRTTINAQYLHAGRHTGYEIRPSKRRCGDGTALLRLRLDKARERGLHRVLLTCDETNTGSRKIIEANGGSWKMPWWWRDKPAVNCATRSIWMRSPRLSMQPTPNPAGCALVS